MLTTKSLVLKSHPTTKTHLVVEFLRGIRDSFTIAHLFLMIAVLVILNIWTQTYLLGLTFSLSNMKSVTSSKFKSPSSIFSSFETSSLLKLK